MCATASPVFTMELDADMKLENIEFGGCCGSHGVAEVEVSIGYLALMKSHEDGTIKVRKFDSKKMPLSDWEPMTPAQIDALLA